MYADDDERRHVESGLVKRDLGWPISAESVDVDGRWILVSLLTYLGRGKWRALDEDGQECVLDASSIRNPRID